MLHNAEFFGTFDVTSLVLTAFTLFFIGLVVYLQRESRREGYPVEDDVTGRLDDAEPLVFGSAVKTFRLPHGGVVHKPDNLREVETFRAGPRSRVPGTPLQPAGDPMTAAIGPGAYAQRSKVPDLTAHGLPKIAPLRALPEFTVDKNDPDPRGMTVLGVDGQTAGVVTDVWVDRAEVLIRYLEVEVTGAGKRVLMPMTVCVVGRSRRVVKTDAITAAQFADVPVLASPDQVTMDEEERVSAYYGGGYLYATAARAEPIL
jgi:photosynthetic reaction center H subunit